MAGWYELSKSTDGQFRFVLKAGNAETILTSELYTVRASAENGIASDHQFVASQGDQGCIGPSFVANECHRTDVLP